MTAVRAPRSVKAATVLAERYAVVDGEIAAIEEARRDALAKVNADHDALAAVLLPEHRDLGEKLRSWWPGVADELTGGKRKSIELGGCEIGSRSGIASLGVAGNEQATALVLGKKRWARQLVRVSVSLDRAAILKSIDGAHGAELVALGLSRVPGIDTVFVKRVKQGGTQGGAATR